MKERNPLRPKIAIIIIDNFDPIEGVLRADKATSAILKEVYEEVVKAIPEKKAEEVVQQFNDGVRLTKINPYNQAIDQFKSNLRLLTRK